MVELETINGVEVAKVVISAEIVPDPEKRYLIAHLLRNIIIRGAIIYNYDEQGNNFTMAPAIEVDEDFIYENKELICKTLYYLLHKDYFNFYRTANSRDKIFSSPLLANINEKIRQLESKMLEEKALFLLDVPVEMLNN